MQVACAAMQTFTFLLGKTLFSLKQQFKKNLKGVNGNQDFDQDMLEDIYCAIK